MCWSVATVIDLSGIRSEACAIFVSTHRKSKELVDFQLILSMFWRTQVLFDATHSHTHTPRGTSLVITARGDNWRAKNNAIKNELQGNDCFALFCFHFFLSTHSITTSWYARMRVRIIIRRLELHWFQLINTDTDAIMFISG